MVHTPRSIVRFWLPRLVAMAMVSLPAAGQLSVVTTAPSARTITAPQDTAITITFDRAVDVSTVDPTTVWVFARWSGHIPGTRTLGNGGTTLTFTPSRAFSAGESVMVLLANRLRGTDGSSLRAAGYSFTFWVAAGRATLDFTEVNRFTTRTTPGESSRAYGGFGSDLDGDGFLDITVVNEDTNDLRVFLNPADGSHAFGPFLMPTAPTGSVPSPSEPSDFDGDGDVDVAVADIGSSSLSILLGQGDGTFGPRQALSLDGTPRGVAVLDVDGDGDVDVAVTERGTGRIVVVRNDGTGTFGSATSFGPGVSGAWALGAADMNEDGVLDLVMGNRDNARIYVYTNDADGSGTFTLADDVPSGGGTWMLNLGDVDGDGHEDVVVANSSTNNGAILLGDGTGNLGSATTYATDPFPLATDLGDLDGDGDLDWVTASFSGDWFLFRNDGSGSFAFERSFEAPLAASCSLAMDLDNDGDLDLALIDELEDEVILFANDGALFADGFESGDLSAWSTSVP